MLTSCLLEVSQSQLGRWWTVQSSLLKTRISELNTIQHPDRLISTEQTLGRCSRSSDPARSTDFLLPADHNVELCASLYAGSSGREIVQTPCVHEDILDGCGRHPCDHIDSSVNRLFGTRKIFSEQRNPSTRC